MILGPDLQDLEEVMTGRRDWTGQNLKYKEYLILSLKYIVIEFLLC